METPTFILSLADYFTGKDMRTQLDDFLPVVMIAKMEDGVIIVEQQNITYEI